MQENKIEKVMADRNNNWPKKATSWNAREIKSQQVRRIVKERCHSATPRN